MRRVASLWRAVPSFQLPTPARTRAPLRQLCAAASEAATAAPAPPAAPIVLLQPLPLLPLLGLVVGCPPWDDGCASSA